MIIKSILAGTSLAVLGLASITAAPAATHSVINQRVTTTLAQFDGLSTANSTLLGKSAGVLVFPKVTKGGVGIAAEYGEGVLQVSGKTVGYYKVSAASIGLTLGVAKHSEIIMFMTPESLTAFRDTKGWSIGADAGITIVSGGASGSYDSKIEQKPILGFAFAEKGLLGDLSFEGEKISVM